MKKLAVVANAGTPFARQLIADLLDEGWRIHAGYYKAVPDSLPENVTAFAWTQEHSSFIAARDALDEGIDMLVTDFDCPEELLSKDDTASINEAYDWHTLVPLRMVNAFLPLLAKGELKRICFTTTKACSNYLCDDYDNQVERISRAPLNMAATQLFNGLHPEGYTFRMYCKSPDGTRDQWACEYFTRDRSFEPWDLKHSDEERIILHDWMGKELPW